MSFIPPNSRLQLSDTSGNINNKGVVGSNTKAPYLTTFPTSNTGTSQGTYLHLGVDGQSNLRTDFLNASGTSSGGFNFWTSNSTQAPQELAQITTDGVLVDTQIVVNKSAPTRVFSPPVYSISPDNIHINFPPGTDLTQAPYNFIYGFNPIYMTQNTGFYTINTLCYAALGDPTQIVIFNNDNTTNPIPPNTYPTGFPIGNATGITVGEPIFALSPPSSTTQSTLSDTLTITDGTNTSVLSATNLTFNGIPISGSPASTSSFNVLIDYADSFSIPVVLIDGAIQFTSASTILISSSGESEYLLTFTTPISNTSIITATYFSQSQKTFHSITVSYTATSITLTSQNGQYVYGLNNFYFGGIIFST